MARHGRSPNDDPARRARLARYAELLVDELINAGVPAHELAGLRTGQLVDLVIATRFHNVLKALRLGRPVISIGYATKNDDLMREMGLEQYCHHVDNFEPAQVLEQVRSLAAMPRPPVAKIHERVTEYRQALASQFDRILELGRSTED